MKMINNDRLRGCLSCFFELEQGKKYHLGDIMTKTMFCIVAERLEFVWRGERGAGIFREWICGGSLVVVGGLCGESNNKGVEVVSKFVNRVVDYVLERVERGEMEQVEEIKGVRMRKYNKSELEALAEYVEFKEREGIGADRLRYDMELLRAREQMRAIERMAEDIKKDMAVKMWRDLQQKIVCSLSETRNQTGQNAENEQITRVDKLSCNKKGNKKGAKKQR